MGEISKELGYYLRNEEDATILIMTRHVKTRCNDKRIVQGARTSSMPSEVGYMQIQKLTKELEKYHIDSIVSSPQGRCVTTVTPFAMKKGLEIRCMPGLKERDYGIFDGKDAQLYDRWKEANDAYNYSYSPPEGESFIEVKGRVSESKDEILKENAGKTVLVCGHKGTNTALLLSLFNKPENHYNEYATDNASITIVKIKNGIPELLLFNSTAHLDMEKSKCVKSIS